MSIDNSSLRAFLKTHEVGSFTQAAKELGLTQSALSQKIARLEDQLESALFNRKADGLNLTSFGEKLLVFAKQQIHWEEDFLNQFKSDGNGVKGQLRLAGFSSIMRSMIIPQVAPWLRKNPNSLIEFASYEVAELPQVLKSNQADLIILDYFTHLPGVIEKQIGVEEYVLIESAKYKNVPNVYLDHGPLDNATEAFFHFQGEKMIGRRSFMGDVYGILDGVAMGLGKAVMSKHMVERDPRFRIVKSKKNYSRPIVLAYFEQGYYSQIQTEIIECLKF